MHVCDPVRSDARHLPCVGTGGNRRSGGVFDEQRAGLGERFERDLITVVQAVTAQPLFGKLIEGRIRIARFKTFRYNLVYIPDPDEIVIVAVAHHRRRPGYWRSRLSLLS